jgi:glycosyltransferase involved in cell wall biosynthesis
MVALVRALAKVPSAQRIQLAWIGDGPARNALLAAAHEARVPLVLTGAVARDELPGYLAHLDVVVFPGPAGAADRMAVLEAMAAGRAVIAPAVEPFTGLMRNGADGLLAAGADEAAFAEALGRLAASGRLRADLGREARHVAAKARTWDAVASEILEFARECAGATEDVG